MIKYVTLNFSSTYRIAIELNNRMELNDEELYQKTRRIVIAEMQNVVYGQWLMEIIGPEMYETLQLDPALDSSYDSTVDPSILNSFATAAFRFGHSMLQDFFLNVAATITSRLNIDPTDGWRLKENFFNATFFEEDFDAVLNGLQFQEAEAMDANVVEDVTNGLFQNIMRAGDLVTRNLQRGREHGLPGYNEFREVGIVP